MILVMCKEMVRKAEMQTAIPCPGSELKQPKDPSATDIKK